MVSKLYFPSSPLLIYPQKGNTDLAFYCSVCSDSLGVLEFYTNGMAIRDTTHEVMLNGNHLNQESSGMSGSTPL